MQSHNAFVIVHAYKFNKTKINHCEIDKQSRENNNAFSNQFAG